MDNESEKDGSPLAVVTGASSGIGFELARVFAKNGYHVLVAAEDKGINEAGDAFRQFGHPVDAIQTNLSTYEGVENLYAKIKSLHKPVDCLVLNAGVGLGGEFLTTDLQREIEMIRLNNISAVHLTKRVLPELVAQGHGRVLFTSSIAATMPGPYYAVYAATKSFIHSFAEAIREEVREKGITVTALQPGPTDTAFFSRADMLDTPVAEKEKDDPKDVAEEAFKALMDGKDHVITGSLMNTVQAKMANIMTSPMAAKMHKSYTKPESSRE